MCNDTAPIDVQGLTRRYGDRQAVDAVSFTVPAGSVCGIVGPNGAGKTTLIRMLLGLVAPSSGTVRVLGSRPGSAGYPAALRQVGAIVEVPALYRNATARANLRIRAASLGLAADRRREEDLLALVGLAGRGGKRVRSYSLGMRQRLAIAVALLGAPRLLVLDEPTNGLDPTGIAEIRGLIGQLGQQGVTVLVSSHLLGELQLMCDRVVVMADGRLVAAAPMRELLDARHATLEDAFLALTAGSTR
jgi:ABC-2 type transport system ATP-binding protein